MRLAELIEKWALMSLLALPVPLLAQNEGPTGRWTALDGRWSVVSPPVSALRGDPRLSQTLPPPRSSAWERIQDPLDRSLGRIEDGVLYDLAQLERRHDERLGLVDSQREFERLEQERERQLRLDAQRLRLDQLSERQRRLELDRREYLLELRSGGLSPMARQVEADRLALQQARAQFNRELLDAHAAYRRALQQPGADSRALEQQLQAERARIRAHFEQTRMRILGD